MKEIFLDYAGGPYLQSLVSIQGGGEGRVLTAEGEAMRRQDRDGKDAAPREGMAGATRSWRRREGPSLGASRGTGARLTLWFQISSLQTLRTNSIWTVVCVAAAPGS